MTAIKKFLIHLLVRLCLAFKGNIQKIKNSVVFSDIHQLTLLWPFKNWMKSIQERLASAQEKDCYRFVKNKLSDITNKYLKSICLQKHQKRFALLLLNVNSWYSVWTLIMSWSRCFLRSNQPCFIEKKRLVFFFCRLPLDLFIIFFVSF